MKNTVYGVKFYNLREMGEVLQRNETLDLDMELRIECKGNADEDLSGRDRELKSFIKVIQFLQ